MRYVEKARGALAWLVVVVGFTFAFSGCDSGAGQSTQYKPIESNILKKLGSAGQAQGDAAQEKLPARVKSKKKG